MASVLKNAAAAGAAALILCLFAVSAGADLLTNESFELGNLTGWTAYGSSPACTIQTATPAPGCGTYYLYEMLPTMNTDGGVYQTVSGLTPGATYRISGSKKSMHSDILVSVKCDTNGGTNYALAEQTVSAASTTTNWAGFSADVTATGTSMTVFLHSAQVGGTKANHVGAFDCVTMTFLCNPPAPPANVTASPSSINAGGSSTLSASVEGGCTADWYTGGCSGTLIGSGTSLVVSPGSTTTYYPRARNVSNGCLSPTCGQAVTVTVRSTSAIVIRPSNMAEYGWQIATSNGGTGTFTKGGPVVSEYTLGPAFPAGDGGFYATCKEISSGTPSTVWIGLDKLCTGFDQYGNPQFKSLQLIRLNQIKKIEYKTYVPTIPTIFNKIGELHYPKQPIHVAIATAKNQPPGYLNRRWYVNMPWPNNIGVFGNEVDRYGHWDINSAAPWNGTTAGWYCATLGLKWDTWEEMVAARGTEVLVPTSTYWDPTPVNAVPPRDPLGWKTCGYSELTVPAGDMNATGTGTAINFYVGARDLVAELQEWYDEPMTAWWRESFGFRGYLDEVTIGVQFDDIGYVEATYDFEPDEGTPDVTTVAMSQKNVILPSGTGAWVLNPIVQRALINKGVSGAGKGAIRVKCFGRVISYGQSSSFGDYFDLYDGSVSIDPATYDPPYPWNPESPEKMGEFLWQRPLPVRVHVPDAGGMPPAIGEYWSATGYPVVLYWDNPIPPGEVTEVCGQLYLYSAIENCQRLQP